MTIRADLIDLMLVPGLSGHEERVARAIRDKLAADGIAATSDRMGNLTATFPGDPAAPSVMLFTHMDQLGFFVRKVEDDGLIRVERMGGVSERAMAAQAVVLCTDKGDVPGLIMNKAHHATGQDEKYRVLTTPEIRIDTGHGSKQAVEAAGIRIGTPVVYRPQVVELAGSRIAGTSIDDRAGCAVQIEVARRLKARQGGPTVHCVWTVQEEFNLRGGQVAAQRLKPDCAIQIDIALTSDTPDMADKGDLTLGGGPAISLYNFHGRGTLNGTIPHPAMVRLMETTAATAAIPLQRYAMIGVLTDLAYVQLVGEGVAAIDVAFPMRHSHSALEVCDTDDLDRLADLLTAALAGIGPDFPLIRDP